LLVAVGFAVLAFIVEDPTWGVVAFGIMLYGEVRNMMANGKYTRTFRSILKKYGDAVESTDLH